MFGNVAAGGKAEYGELLALAALTVVKNSNYAAFGTNHFKWQRGYQAAVTGFHNGHQNHLQPFWVWK